MVPFAQKYCLIFCCCETNHTKTQWHTTCSHDYQCRLGSAEQLSSQSCDVHLCGCIQLVRGLCSPETLGWMSFSPALLVFSTLSLHKPSPQGSQNNCFVAQFLKTLFYSCISSAQKQKLPWLHKTWVWYLNSITFGIFYRLK